MHIPITLILLHSETAKTLLHAIGLKIYVLFAADLRDYIAVEWTSLESGRKYDNDEMKLLFGEGEEVVSQSSHQHK